MEKDPNGPPAEGYPPPPTYNQQQSPGYPPAPQAGYVQPGTPGYAPQPGTTAYAPQPYSGQPGTYVVTQQNVQPATHVTIIRNRPNNHLGLAIFVTICCCLPFGIIGIVHSMDSSSKFDRGDVAGSEASANTAKSWSIAGLVCGIILITICIILQVVLVSWTSNYEYDSY